MTWALWFVAGFIAVLIGLIANYVGHESDKRSKRKG